MVDFRSQVFTQNWTLVKDNFKNETMLSLSTLTIYRTVVGFDFYPKVYKKTVFLCKFATDKDNTPSKGFECHHKSINGYG